MPLVRYFYNLLKHYVPDWFIIILIKKATHLSTFEKYEKDKENANLQIEALRQKIDAKRENIMKMAANVVNIQEKKEEVNHSYHISMIIMIIIILSYYYYIIIIILLLL